MTSQTAVDADERGGRGQREWLTGVLRYLAVRNPPSWRRRWDVHNGPAFQNVELKPHCAHTHTQRERKTESRRKKRKNKVRNMSEIQVQVFWRVKLVVFCYSEGLKWTERSRAVRTFRSTQANIGQSHLGVDGILSIYVLEELRIHL